jgi:hypothetical protein
VAPAALPFRGAVRTEAGAQHQEGGGPGDVRLLTSLHPGSSFAPSENGRTSGASRPGTRAVPACGGDLEVIQEQPRQASIKTMTIYAKVTKEDKARAADALAKAYRDSQRNGRSGASWRRRQPITLGEPTQGVAGS